VGFQPPQHHASVIGYTAGVYDMFHPGHAALLERARLRCDHLTLGLSTDELARYKGKAPVMSYHERHAVLRAVRWVDSIVPQTDLDKFAAWGKLRFNVIFVGDDWYGTAAWNRYEAQLAEVGVSVVYLPYTPGLSSSELRRRLA
jgi:glycerol-3-phosphate cytidylyltransferase